MRSRHSLPSRLLLLAAVLTATLLPAAIPSSASASSVYWQLSSSTAPGNLRPGGEGLIVARVSDGGTAQVSGEKSAIVITDKLPPHFTATDVFGALAESSNREESPLKCTPEKLPSTGPLVCTFKGVRPPGTTLNVYIKVKLDPSTPETSVEPLSNVVEVSGGEPSAPTSSQQLVTVSSLETKFGIEKYELKPEEENGAPDLQAGSHPFQLTTTLALNQNEHEEPVKLPRNFDFNLPQGLLGNPTKIPQCSTGEFDTLFNVNRLEVLGPINQCKPNTAVGVAEVTIDEPSVFPGGPGTFSAPVFNLSPEGEPARFGFVAVKVPVVLETAVRTGHGYGVVAKSTNISQAGGLVNARVKIWGVPGDPAHNSERGWECAGKGLEFTSQSDKTKPCAEAAANREKEEEEEKKKGTFQEPAPFLQLPTYCGKNLEAPMRAQPWLGNEEASKESEYMPALTGCNLLVGELFEPVLAGEGPKGEALAGVQPETTNASTPTGLTVRVKIPQHETAHGLVTDSVRSTTVTLPEGMLLNPGASNGLEACSALEMEFEGSSEATQTSQEPFGPGPDKCEREGENGPPTHPGSKVGEVTIVSPDLKTPLKGPVFLAEEGTHPFAPPLVLYVDAYNEEAHVRVKLAGKVMPDPSTGRITSTFEETPDVPFKELTFTFFGGAQSSTSTPPLCGSYATTSSFVPWSGNTPATPSASFSIGAGPGGGPCPTSSILPFSPGFSAGSTNLQAGAFTPFAVNLEVPDGSQSLTGLSTHLPPGMAALLSSVTPCPIGQADANQCGPGSLVGHSLSVSGLGEHPYSLPGTVYLTGPYDGAPFGLSVSTPAVAGPFNLGTVIANSTIQVDPNDASVTVTARETRILEETGNTVVAGTALPTIIKGVPVALKALHVNVDRPNFQFNPTNCNAKEISGALAGSQGANVPIKSRFQVANCASLPFAPKLTASTLGQADKVNGAQFDVKLESAGLGQANIEKVDLQLPAALPSRLSTIQKACPDTTFNANPATCGEGSNIGHAVIHTPVFKNPLEGPAYLVSHGNAAFPDVEFVLQGEGVEIVLDGKTDIKNGITYSRFETSPDAPFTSFETILPQGPHSALTAYTPKTPYNLCGTALQMPTEITGQNGAFIKETTNIAVLNCKAVKSFKETALQHALKACKAKYKKNKKKRQKCEAAARKKYGPKHKKSKKKKK